MEQETANLSTTVQNLMERQTNMLTSEVALGNAPKWRGLVARIEKDMKDESIDALPRNLAEIIAKLICRESRGDKSVLFYGSTGTGKTFRMNFIRSCIRETFAVNAADIFETANAGQDIDDLILFNTRCHAHLFIDDLGTEPESSLHYGQKTFPLAEAIEKRYIEFIKNKYQTFFTTNLKPDEIAKRYGERAFSRLNEMCVMINLSGKDRRMK